MDKVLVMMSSYNGERYIYEQIESILNQTNVDVHLLIRDDGSTDRTVEIIKGIDDKRVNIIEGENKGYANSFLNLLKCATDCDWYAFSDQDDIWLHNKLEQAIIKMTSSRCDVYASSLTIVDENMNITGKKTFSQFNASIGSVLSRNRLAGCTMVFSKAMKKLIDRNLNEIIEFNTIKFSHDGWILLLMAMYGKKLYLDKESYIMYRRHSQSITNISGGIRKRIRNELSSALNRANYRVILSNRMIKISEKENDVDKHAMRTLTYISRYRKNNRYRLMLIVGNQINTNLFIVDLINKLAVFLGRY